VQKLSKIPVAFFWYYEFKSFGENSTFVYGKKAPIFNIVEMMFEPKISKLFGRNTPSDGIHDVELDPKDYGIKEENKEDKDETDISSTD